MSQTRILLGGVSAALLLSVFALPAEAIDLGSTISGLTGGSTSATATVAGSHAGVHVGVTSLDLNAHVDVLSADGAVTGTANAGDISAEAGVITEEDLLNLTISLDGGRDGGGGGGGISPEGIGAAFASLSGGEQQFLRNRCRAVLLYPKGYDANAVALCRLIARLR
jgi:hypothetical protein